MCGIIGIIGKSDAARPLLDALRRLEYRGYDSAGIATLVNGGIERRRAEGKLDNLEARLKDEPVSGRTGIGHTRWATHGVPNEKNAHPHATDRVAIVHNGIIENFQSLRDELEAAGHRLASDTDTEVVVHLISLALEQGRGPEDAVAAVLGRLDGAFALGIIFAGNEDLMIAARQGSPLAIGIGANGPVPKRAPVERIRAARIMQEPAVEVGKRPLAVPETQPAPKALPKPPVVEVEVEVY